MRRLALTSTLMLIVVAALGMRPVPAQAHALLVWSDPPQGARLRNPPARVTAAFSEPLEPGISTLRVLDGEGGRVDAGGTEYDARDAARMSVAVPDGLGAGFYSVTWETLSRVDGHIWFGSFEFTVLNPDGTLPTGPRRTAEAASADTAATIAARSTVEF